MRYEVRNNGKLVKTFTDGDDALDFVALKLRRYPDANYIVVPVKL